MTTGPTGILGGVFDPPHLGHLALAEGATRHFGLERLIVVPTGIPPHKRVETPADTRYRLALAAFADRERTHIVEVELERPDPSYTIDTLRLAGREWGDDLVLLVGADEFADFLSWRDPDGILQLARLGVATRPGIDADGFESVLRVLASPERVTLFPVEPHDVSSTEVRERVARGEPIAALVPAAVARLVAELGLYREDDH